MLCNEEEEVCVIKDEEYHAAIWQAIENGDYAAIQRIMLSLNGEK